MNLNIDHGLKYRMVRLTALQLYSYLPKKNCGKCGEDTCMAFAMKLIEREKQASDCPELTEDGLKKLVDILTPPVRDVRFHKKEREIVIGGEEVMYRHELKFFNQTKIMLDISDLMNDKEIKKRIDFVKEFEFERIGEKLKMDGIAIRCASDDTERYKSIVRYISDIYDGPIMLCSFKPDILGDAIDCISDRKPLLYAATKDNIDDMMKIAIKYDVPLVIYEEDLSTIGTMTRKLNSMNFNQIVMDMGFDPRRGNLGKSLNRFAMVRMSAINGTKELGYPLMVSTVPIYGDCGKDITLEFYESNIACILLHRFISLLVVHTMNPWSIIPLLVLRQNIYADPRIEPSAEPKLYEINNPDENSPVLLTTNFALTYFNVSSDLENAKIPAYLLVIDTEGLAVAVSLAAGKLTPTGIKRALEENDVDKRVKHRKLIIPGLAARLKVVIEEKTKWDVVIGPTDSSQIGGFLKERWKNGC